MDEVAKKDFTHHLSSAEFERYKKTWSISLNTSGRNAPMKLRSDFSEALTKMHRHHRESGEERLATDSFLAVSEMASVVFFIQHNHGGSGMTIGGAHKIHQIQVPLSS